MHSETLLWTVAVPLISLVLLMVVLIVRITKRRNFSIQLKGLGVELNVVSTSESDHISDDKEVDHGQD